MLKYLISDAAPKFRASVPQSEVLLEFTEPFLASLEATMLAQAQEGVWQRAVMGQYLLYSKAPWPTSSQTITGTM